MTRQYLTIEPLTQTLRAIHNLQGDPNRLAIVISGPLGRESAVLGTTDDVDQAYDIAADLSAVRNAAVLTASSFRPTVVGKDVAAIVLAEPANQPTGTLEQLGALAAMLTDADQRAILDALPDESDRLIIDAANVTPNLVSLLWLRRLDAQRFELTDAGIRMHTLLAEPMLAEAQYTEA